MTDLGTATAVSWPLGTTVATVVLTVTNPDGTTATPAVSETTGTYSATVATTQPGRYRLSWAKDAAPAAKYTDILDVWPADPRFLISLSDARSALSLSTAITTYDEDLRLYIAACTVVIEDITGGILTQTRTQKADGGRHAITLNARPNPDLPVTVTVDGTALASTGFIVDYEAAIVYAVNGGWFPAGRQNVAIAYTVGSNVIPPNIRLATSELLRHMWQVGKQASRPAWGDAADSEAMSTTPSGFAVPNRVIELCAANPRLPGLA